MSAMRLEGTAPPQPERERRFYTPREVAEILRREGEERDGLRWVYRHSSGGGFLEPFARRFGRMLLFDRAALDAFLAGPEEGKGA